MPYKKIQDLPGPIRQHLPHHAQEIYLAAFNSAWNQYGQEENAHKVAWSAVKKSYHKNEKAEWVKNS